MSQTTHITIEHIVVASHQPYEQVLAALDARLGSQEDQAAIVRQLMTPNTSWEQIMQTIDEHVGASGFTLFSKVNHGFLLSLVGKTSRATQYTIGNPTLALQMTSHFPEVGLYAPLRLVVYEDEEGRTFIAYDSFVSLLIQYQREEITRVARVVEHKLEVLVAEATTAQTAG
jgi:uncharacterized protein (DUF302 family)